MSVPIISVILPVFNAKDYVAESVQSVLNQTMQEFELILIDDGATDGSAQIIDRIAENDTRVRVYHQSNNGICYTRNRGLELARGEYIAFCDHDDFYDPDYLKKTYDIMLKQNVDVVKFSYNSIHVKNGKELEPFCYRLKQGPFLLTENVDYRSYSAVVAVIWNGLYRKEFLDREEIRFEEHFKAGWEDIYFCFELIRKGAKIYTIPDILFSHYLRQGQSTSAKYNTQRRNDNLICAESERDLFLEQGISDSEMWIEHQLFYITNYIKELLYPECELTECQKLKGIREFRKKDSVPMKLFSINTLKTLRRLPTWKSIKWCLYHLWSPGVYLIMKKNGHHSW